MYLVVSPEEVCATLAKQTLIKEIKTHQLQWTQTQAYVSKIKKRLSKTKLLDIDFGAVNDLLMKDLLCWRDHVNTHYKQNYRPLIAQLANKIHSLDVDEIIKNYQQMSEASFIKNLGHHLDESNQFVLSGTTVPDDQVAVLRNIYQNEQLVRHRLKHQLPFWFVDTGYTNFLTGKKHWHRLVKNHIHHDPSGQSYPADRLGTLESFPRSWKISQPQDPVLVIENSESHHAMFNKSLHDWRRIISLQLSQYTTRPVKFRPKDPDKKTRDSLIDLLNKSNYHCVITDASNSAIEAIWAGIPVIVLNRHISLPVARHTIADIENLYRGPIGDWLCALTYNQFSMQEIMDGTAVDLIRKYDHV